MEIKEIYHHGDKEVAYYLGNPIMPDINTGDATTINAILSAQLPAGDTHKFSKLASDTVKVIAKSTGLFSVECTESECLEYATNKIIITNKEKLQEFFICGFAIMGKIVTCPPLTA